MIRYQVQSVHPGVWGERLHKQLTRIQKKHLHRFQLNINYYIVMLNDSGSGFDVSYE